ncbi:MAG TPA: PA2169 family four-helix-bundle protein [Ilumatobacter sp.]|nr:PA2169 family four-helix-bundle protein [Ilumatobacter sp.]
MTTDERIAKQLTKTLENGKVGFEQAAERLGDERPDVAARFLQFSQERATMSNELAQIAAAYGDDVDQRSTVPGALHRGWMAVKDALTSSDAQAVINAAESGEDHAVEEYRDALNEADISAEFRAIVARQATSVQAAHDYVSSLSS